MIRVTCRIGLARGTLGRQASLRDELAAKLPQSFADGSRSDIALDLDFDDFESKQVQIPNGKNANNVALGIALERLIGKNPASTPSTATVGLLLADRFSPANEIFGVMFDDGSSNLTSFDAVQRQGAALFLDAIADKRGGGQSPDFIRQAIYSATHELGHIFNLPHKNQTANFMRESRPNEPVFGPEAFRFEADQVDFLSRCSQSPFVRPGGSRWKDRNALPVPGIDSGSHDGARQQRGLTLRAHVTPAALWCFEPIELDLDLRLSRRAARPIEVSNQLDPSYDRMKVWVTKPNGERLLLRYPMYCCENPATIRLVRGGAFHRDVTLSVAAANPLFHDGGCYKIEVAFQISARETLRSNQVEIEILTSRRDDRLYNAARRVLTDADVARLMMHRRIGHRRAVVSLKELIDSQRRGRVTDACRYSLGRALLDQAGTRMRKTAHEEGRELLKAAADSRHIGEHRRRLAEQMSSS